jgi:hypothetical protein
MLHVLMAAVLLQQAPRIDEKRVQELVEKFGDEAIAEREAAVAELLAMGEAVLPLLEKAKGAAAGEARARIEKVIGELTLPTRWAKEIIEGDPGQGYQRLDQALRGKELDRAQGARILSAVLLNEASSPEHRNYMINIAERHRIREIWPALLQLLGRDDPGNENFAYNLQRLRLPREAAPALLKLIPKLQNSNISYQLLEIARGLKPERAAMEACIGAILEGEDENMRTNVLSSLRQGRYPAPLRSLLKCWRSNPALRPHLIREPILATPPGDALADMLDLFKSAEADDVQLAIDYVARQKVAAGAGALAKLAEDSPELRPRAVLALKALRCVEEVRKWIAGQGGPGRRAAIALAGELAWAETGPDIARCLDDPDAGVRKDAAVAVGALKVADAAPKLEALIKDGDAGVRRAAVLSLAALLGKGATKTVLAQMRSENADVQAAAVEALPLVDAEQALAELTTEEALGRPITRYALAFMIVKGGQPTLHRVMARAGAKLSVDELHGLVRLIQTAQGR